MAERMISPLEYELICRIIEYPVESRYPIVPIGADDVIEEIRGESTIRFRYGGEIRRRQKKYQVEAESLDVDGMTVHALLFVADGRVTELEMFKDDSSGIIRLPSAEQWRCLDLG